MADGGEGGVFSVRRIRRLDSRKLSLIDSYGRESLGEAAIGEWMLPVIASFGLLYVAEAGEEIIGSAQLISCLEEGDLYMDIFYIRPAYRRRGLGLKFLEAVKEGVAAEDFKRILVTFDPDNAAARRLYEKAGFKQVDYLPDYYGSGRHRLLLSVTLS